MELMLDKLEKILMPLAEAIGRNKYLISIRDGFLVSTPLLIAGSLFLLIANFPVPGWPEFLESIEMGNGMTLATFLSKPSDATFTIMAIFATMGIAYSYAKQIDTDRIFGAATALMSWFLLMPYVVDGTVTVGGKDVTASMSGIPLGWVGAKGIFVGIIIAFTSVALYAWVKRRGWVIKMPAGVPPTVVESFSALIPIMVTMGVFFLINTVFGMFGTDVFDIIFVWLQTPLLGLGDTLGAMVIAYVFLHLFWFFGINGSSVVGAVFNPILQTLAVENLEFFKTGIGEGHIICQQFQDLFATFGGAGSTQARPCPRHLQHQRAGHLRPADRHEPAHAHPVHAGADREHRRLVPRDGRRVRTHLQRYPNPLDNAARNLGLLRDQLGRSPFANCLACTRRIPIHALHQDDGQAVPVRRAEGD